VAPLLEEVSVVALAAVHRAVAGFPEEAAASVAAERRVIGDESVKSEW
jgi:hypothetical protein